MRIEIDHSAFDALPETLSREMVNEQTDGALLAGWYDALTEKAAELDAFAKAMSGIGDDMVKAAGKIAFCKIAARWIEQRMIAIGARVPYPPADQRAVELGRQANRIRQLRAQVIALGGDPEEGTFKARQAEQVPA